MGKIQQAINQAIGTVGIASKLSPELTNRRELKGLEQEAIKTESLKSNIKDLPKLRKNISSKSLEEVEAKTAGDIELGKKILKRQADISQKQLELDPTPERYLAAAQSQGEYSAYVKKAEKFGRELEERRNAAKKRALSKVDNRTKQFEDFLSNLTVAGQNFNYENASPAVQAQIKKAWEAQNAKK